jgi:lipopolysaccharide transport system ATP-binding protein
MTNDGRILPDDEPVALRLRGVSKRYVVHERPLHRLRQILLPADRRGRDGAPEHVVLQDVDLDVRRGETFGLVGRNGSGKTTLLRIACGIVPPSSGTVAIRGRVAPLLALGAGFHPDFSGRENARLNAAVLGLDDGAIEERLASIEAFADIGTAIDDPVRTYSSGMFARLAFAVAVSVDPDVLVVDEILSVGDELFARKCFARIEDLRRGGATILFVSHAMNTVLELCDRAALLEGGSLVAVGEPREIVRRYHATIYAGIVDRPSAPKQAETSTNDEPAAVATDDGGWDPTLASQSAREDPPNGARIEGLRVVGLGGARRNRLRSRSRYEVRYEIVFDRDVEDVRCGCNLRTVEGVALAGLVAPIARAARGDRFAVRFPIEPRLLPGTYFLTVGVRTLLDQGFLHRLIEVEPLVVEPADDDVPRFGYLAIDAAPPTAERLLS